ncbi:MAG: hypothetical protein IPK44_13700 [Candidatus Accumulibacter sp.]|nr:hypothetical protein [Accumulibacter sp.]MBK8115497.1 hypothetical protein [Accumulibacter sp.]
MFLGPLSGGGGGGGGGGFSEGAFTVPRTPCSRSADPARPSLPGQLRL